MVKRGTGTLTLLGANTYNSGTSVLGGTLAGTTTSLQRNITNNANVAFNQATDGTYSGIISGTGSLTKQGTGDVTLSGANTFSGGTTISGGTLTGNTTSLQGNIVDNAVLTFNQSATGTYSGNISGTGSFTKLGSGNLTLSGTNTYSGGATVSEGTLTGTTSSLQGKITNNGAVVFDQSITGTYSSNMSGTGSLTKKGTGRLILQGANTFSGGLNLNAGSLYVGDDASLGAASASLSMTGGILRPIFSFSSPRNITLTGTTGSVDPEGGKAVTLSGLISGTGSFTVSYSGDGGSGSGGSGGSVVLTNTNNSYSGGTIISGGILHVSSDSCLGDPSGGITFANVVISIGNSLDADASFTTARPVTLTNGGGFVAHNHDLTLSGLISGAGQLTLSGGGTITLSNAGNTYSGGTYISNTTMMISSDADLGALTAGLTIDGGTIKPLNSLTISSSRSITLVNQITGNSFDSSGYDFVIPGQIKGSGYLVKAGEGTLTLTNSTNSFNGVRINGGTIAVAADSMLGGVSSNVTINGGTLRNTASFSTIRLINFTAAGGTIDTAGNDLTLNGQVTVSGPVTKIGDGVFTLTNGANPFSDGGVTVNGGTLKVSNSWGSADRHGARKN